MRPGQGLLFLVIALLVTVILVSVVCSALITSLQAEQTSDFLGIATSMTFSFTEVVFKIGAWHSTQATPDSTWIPCGNL